MRQRWSPGNKLGEAMRRYGDIQRRCCRFPPARMPTAACRSRPVRTIGSPSVGSPWPRVCAGWPPRRGPVRSRAAASKTACSASTGRKPPCRTGPRIWSPTSTGGCPTRGSRTSCSRWTPRKQGPERVPGRFTEEPLSAAAAGGDGEAPGCRGMLRSALRAAVPAEIAAKDPPP